MLPSSGTGVMNVPSASASTSILNGFSASHVTAIIVFGSAVPSTMITSPLTTGSSCCSSSIAFVTSAVICARFASCTSISSTFVRLPFAGSESIAVIVYASPSRKPSAGA